MLVITSYAKSYASKSVKAYSIRELLCTLLGMVHKKQVIRLILLYCAHARTRVLGSSP